MKCTSVSTFLDHLVAKFLLAFCHFAAQRSLPQVMMFDNVTTYTPAVEELTDSLSSEEIRTVLG